MVAASRSLPQHRQLSCRQACRTIRSGGPGEAALVQNLVIKAEALAIPEQKLDPVTPAGHGRRTPRRGRLLSQVRLNQRGETVDPLTHIDRPAGQIDAGTRSWPDHASSATRMKPRRSQHRANDRTSGHGHPCSGSRPCRHGWLCVFSHSPDPVRSRWFFRRRDNRHRQERRGNLVPVAAGGTLGARRKSVAAGYRAVAATAETPKSLVAASIRIARFALPTSHDGARQPSISPTAPPEPS